MTLHASEVAACIAIAAWGLLIPVVVGYIVLLEMLFFRLRRKCPTHYEEIGSPSVFLNNSISKGGAMMRYVLDRDYLAAQDERAVRLGERSRQLLLTAAVLFGLGLLGFIAFGVLLR
jgi:hypothetical protein